MAVSGGAIFKHRQSDYRALTLILKIVGPLQILQKDRDNVFQIG